MDSVAICNMALGALGQHKIISMGDESVAAELCSTFFTPAVVYCLEQRAWLFATVFMDLGAAQDSGDTELVKKFALSSEVVGVQSVDDGSGNFDLVWERRGSWLFTEETDVCVAWVTKQPDPALWTPTFCWAVAYKIAEAIAVPLTENLGAEIRMGKKCEDHISKAGTLDGVQSSPQRQVGRTFNRSKLSHNR